MALGDLGQHIEGRYRLDRELRRSPHAQSLLVTDLRNGRPCVLRRLFLARASPVEGRRFESQAAILEKFDHPGLPRFIAGFTTGEGEERERILVTSYHAGESLERLISKGRLLGEPQALALLRRIVPVLVYLHGLEPPVVHRGVKLSGIIVGPDGRPCLTDMGFAEAELEAGIQEQAPPGPDELALAAPEVYMGKVVPGSDIYALGLAIIRAMTTEDPAALLREGARPRLRDALGVSEAFAGVLLRMLEPALERRYPDARALEADLAKLAGVRAAVVPQPAAPKPAAPKHATPPAGEPRPRRTSRPLVIAGAVLVLVALALAAMRLRNQPTPGRSLLVPPAPGEQTAVREPAAEAGPSSAPSVDSAARSAAPTADIAPGATNASFPEAGLASGSAEPAPTPAPPIDTPPAVVEGRLSLDGKPFTSVAGPAPSFWFRNDGTRSDVKPQVDYAAGAFTVRDLPPGRYGMSVRIDLDPSNPANYPGDLNGWSEFVVEAARPVSLEVPLRTVIRLRQPVDSGAVIRGLEIPCGAGNVTPAQVVFAWEALDPGVTYQASVDRLVCGKGYASAGRIFKRSITDAWVKVDLEPNREGECYSFRLTANKAGRPVGILATHGKSGLGWDFRFTVSGRQ